MRPSFSLFPRIIEVKDLYSLLKGAVAIGASFIKLDNTPAAVDLQGYHSAVLALAIGVGGITFSGTNKIEYKLTHSDNGTDYSAVEQKDILGATVGTGGIVKSLIAEHAAATVDLIGYVGNKRYVKLLADFDGTHGTETPMAAVWLLGNADVAPAYA